MNVAVNNDMSDADTRRKLFWLLERSTSYTLWQRKRDAWEMFARAYEQAVKTWPRSQPEQLDANSLPRIYQVLSDYNRGLDELAKGRRFVWREGEPLFSALVESNTLAGNVYRHPAYWEHGMQTQPYPPKIDAIYQLLLASRDQNDAAPLERPYRPRSNALYLIPADMLSADRYDYGFYRLPYPVFPASLPELPESSETIVRSGEAVPMDGIWEPIEVSQTKILGVIPAGLKKEANRGAFNYLVKGTLAPRMTGAFDASRGSTERVDVYWQLLWEDTRYSDGQIGDESAYFLTPQTGEKPSHAVADPGEVRTGSICPVAGLWTAQGYNHPPVRCLAGEPMPHLMVDDGIGEKRVHHVAWVLVSRS